MVRKFFCFDLYTTGLLIGWLGLAESITSCITSILVLENVDTTIIPNFANSTTNSTDVRTTVVSLLGSNIALNVIDLLASGLLIAGTIKRNHLLVLPWLINTTISLFFNFIVLILVTVFVTSVPELSSFNVVIIFLFLVFGIYLYAYAAIYSLYHHIKRAIPNSEYSSLIEDRNAKGHPIYTRC